MSALGRAAGNRGATGRAVGRGGRRAPRGRHGAGNHRGRAYLGEPVGSAVCISGASFGWPTDRRWPDSYPGDHRRHRGRSNGYDLRRLKLPVRRARVGRVGVIGAPVAKTAVVASAVKPGPSPVAKAAVVAAVVTPGRRRRIYLDSLGAQRLDPTQAAAHRSPTWAGGRAPPSHETRAASPVLSLSTASQPRRARVG